MKKIKEILNTVQDREIADYCSLTAKIKPLMKNSISGSFKKIKIALLSSFTTRFIEDVLFVKCLEHGINAEIYLCNYNQYSQDIINEESDFYSFKPDLTILFVDIRRVLGDLFFLSYNRKSNDKRTWVEEQINDFELLINKIQSRMSTKLLIHNLEIPTYSPFGILENKQEFGYLESIEYFNMKLREKYKLNNQTFIFDYNLFCSGIGKNNVFDYKLYYLSDIKLKLETIPLLCNEYLRYIKPIASILKKCIVLDLDNTLWGGIVGEDGFDGIKLGPTGQGKPFYEFQKHLLALYNRGIILAINSKNNYEDAMKVINEHPYMILKENHFASIQINWNNKVTNMRIIASEINIGLDSLVFFDDDLLNREMVSSELPEITVVNMPSDPVYYVDSLIELIN